VFLKIPDRIRFMLLVTAVGGMMSVPDRSLYALKCKRLLSDGTYGDLHGLLLA